MKKIKFLIAIIVFAMVSLVGCETDLFTPDVEEQAVVETVETPFEGKWSMYTGALGGVYGQMIMDEVTYGLYNSNSELMQSGTYEYDEYILYLTTTNNSLITYSYLFYDEGQTIVLMLSGSTIKRLITKLDIYSLNLAEYDIE